jgi:hypothetical protein
MAKTAEQIENFRLYVVGGAPRQGGARSRRSAPRRLSAGQEAAPF